MWDITKIKTPAELFNNLFLKLGDKRLLRILCKPLVQGSILVGANSEELVTIEALEVPTHSFYDISTYCNTALIGVNIGLWDTAITSTISTCPIVVTIVKLTTVLSPRELYAYLRIQNRSMTTGYTVEYSVYKKAGLT